MKTCSFAIGCFLGICGIFPSIADTTVRYPSSSPSHLEKGKPFQLVFDKAVVPASEVGKPADPELMPFPRRRNRWNWRWATAQGRPCRKARS